MAGREDYRNRRDLEIEGIYLSVLSFLLFIAFAVYGYLLFKALTTVVRVVISNVKETILRRVFNFYYFLFI